MHRALLVGGNIYTVVKFSDLSAVISNVFATFSRAFGHTVEVSPILSASKRPCHSYLYFPGKHRGAPSQSAGCHVRTKPTSPIRPKLVLKLSQQCQNDGMTPEVTLEIYMGPFFLLPACNTISSSYVRRHQSCVKGTRQEVLVCPF